MRLKESPFKTICTSCSLEAQRVESVLEERAYGDHLAILIIGRIFTHVYENGTKKICRQNLDNPWLFTLCGMDEAELARANNALVLAKNQVITGMRVI